MKTEIIATILMYGFYVTVTVVTLFLLSSVLPIPGGIKTFVVQSGSMEPAIETGSVVVVKQADRYQVGDVITFGPRSKTKPPITHRIVEIKEGGDYVTRGDANEDEDMRTVSQHEVIGHVLITIPYVGYAVAAAQKPWGFTFIIVVPATLIIWEEIQKIRKELMKKADYKRRVEKRQEKVAQTDGNTDENGKKTEPEKI